MAYIEAKNIHKTFGKGDAAVHALRGASLSVDKGEMVAVMGKSGSGKSTLLNILGGLMTMDEGELRVGGKKVDFRKKKYLLNYRRREVGFVVQYFALIDDMNVYKNVSLPLRYQGIPRAKIKQRTTKMLRNLGIEEKAKAYPGELSGGQQQRAAIARALVKNAKIILADEPTGALDEDTGNDVMKLFQRLKMKDRAIIIVTHDSKVAEYCDRIVYLKDGANV
ncbi:MAG TPA: ABC transporter ATP-binding protein [Candidatus Mediterraneibacter merdigallinarum]|nr:ABC transporter ATP-binding protein [Candidatus Mediterraneibacter merdigallinarum]